MSSSWTDNLLNCTIICQGDNSLHDSNHSGMKAAWAPGLSVWRHPWAFQLNVNTTFIIAILNWGLMAHERTFSVCGGRVRFIAIHSHVPPVYLSAWLIITSSQEAFTMILLNLWGFPRAMKSHKMILGQTWMRWSILTKHGTSLSQSWLRVLLHR